MALLERDYSCSGVERVQQPGLPGGDVPSPAEDHVLRRHLCESGLKCQKILEFVIPAWSKLCYTFHFKLTWLPELPLQLTIYYKKETNEMKIHDSKNALIIDSCICVFQSTDLYL